MARKPMRKRPTKAQATPVILRFDQTTCDLIMDQVYDVIDKLALEHGLIVSPKRGRFSPTTFRFQVELNFPSRTQGAPSDLSAKSEDAWYALCMKHGMDPDLLGKRFQLPTATGSKADLVLRITGVNTRARKAPIQLEDVHTKEPYKASPAMLKRAKVFTGPQDVPEYQDAEVDEAE